MKRLALALMLLIPAFSASALVGHIQYFSFENPVYYPVFSEPALCTTAPPCEILPGSDSCKVPIVTSIGTISGYNGYYRSTQGYDFCFKVKNKPFVIG